MSSKTQRVSALAGILLIMFLLSTTGCEKFSSSGKDFYITDPSSLCSMPQNEVFDKYDQLKKSSTLPINQNSLYYSTTSAEFEVVEIVVFNTKDIATGYQRLYYGDKDDLTEFVNLIKEKSKQQISNGNLQQSPYLPALKADNYYYLIYYEGGPHNAQELWLCDSEGAIEVTSNMTNMTIFGHNWKELTALDGQETD